jgi:nucleoid-associated protein YgaU
MAQGGGKVMSRSGARTFCVVVLSAAVACRSEPSADVMIPDSAPMDDSSPATRGVDWSSDDDLGSGDPGRADLGGDSEVSRTHVVRKGDTLFSLARRYYGGDETQWRRILEANRDQIENKDVLRIGQTLAIPD